MNYQVNHADQYDFWDLLHLLDSLVLKRGQEVSIEIRDVLIFELANLLILKLLAYFKDEIGKIEKINTLSTLEELI